MQYFVVMAKRFQRPTCVQFTFTLGVVVIKAALFFIILANVIPAPKLLIANPTLKKSCNHFVVLFEQWAESQLNT